MLIKQSGRITTRRKQAVESFKNAAECIGKIGKEMSIFAITRGQWSMIDAILHCLDQVGRSRLSIWTWTVADYEVQVLNRLMMDNRLIGGCLVIDHGARNKNQEIIASWKNAFGSDAVRYVVNHAKIARIESESGFRLLLRGSMNLNCNPKFENFDLTEGGADYDLVEEIENELPILSDDVSGADVCAASKINQAFDKNQLEMFRGLKYWDR